MFLQRIKDIFNLMKPMGRLRYFVTNFIFLLLVTPVLLALMPNVLFYDGEETLFNAMRAGYFEQTEAILYASIAGIFCYFVQFCLDAKRLFDITNNNTASLVAASVIALIGILLEFFTPYSNELLLLIGSLTTIIVFILLCTIPGTLFKAGKRQSFETESEEDSTYIN